MRKRLPFIIISFTILICSSAAQGQLFDKWGFRLGIGEVVGDDTGRSVLYDGGWGGLLGINGAIILEPKLNLWIVVEGTVREISWRRKRCPNRGYPCVIVDRTITVREFTQGISLLYPVPVLPKIGSRPHIQLGLEHTIF